MRCAHRLWRLRAEWIPAYAGMTVGWAGMAVGWAGMAVGWAGVLIDDAGASILRGVGGKGAHIAEGLRGDVGWAGTAGL